MNVCCAGQNMFVFPFTIGRIVAKISLKENVSNFKKNLQSPYPMLIASTQCDSGFKLYMFEYKRHDQVFHFDVFSEEKSSFKSLRIRRLIPE